MKRKLARAAMAATVLIWAVWGGGGREVHRTNGGGSSFVTPMMSKWASAYEKAQKVQVNYQSLGSGAGIQQMIAKTIDFGCTDAPLNDEQLSKAKQTGGDVVHIPLVMGAVVPIYNLEGIKVPLRFTGAVLADIYLEKMKKWSDPELAKLNPGVELPDKDILTVHRSDGSGTTYIWVDSLSKVSPGWKEKIGVGTSVNWPGGVAAKGNEGVAGKGSQAPGGIGDVGVISALQNKSTCGLVQNLDGQFIQHDLNSVTATP